MSSLGIPTGEATSSSESRVKFLLSDHRRRIDQFRPCPHPFRDAMASAGSRLRAKRSMPSDVGEPINAGMVRHEYFAAVVDDIESVRRAGPRLLDRGHLGTLGGVPLAVITDGQRRLAALSTDSLWIVAEYANHRIQNDAPKLVLDAVRQVVEAPRTGTALTTVSGS